MLPDFPLIKRELNDLVNRYIRQKVRAGDPVIAGVGHVIQHEGDKKTYGTVEGESRELAYEAFGAEFTMTRDEIRTVTIEGVFKKIDDAAEEMAAQFAKSMYETMRRASEEAGTSVDNKGKPFTFDTFIEGLEKITIDFDEMTGEPMMPSFIVSPTMGDTLKKQFPEWEKNPEYMNRYNELIAKKRQEWNDRESNRKLAD